MTLEVLDIKRKFELKFRQLLHDEPILRKLIYEVFVYGTAYIVGGYFRDLLNSKDSRDVDIIIDLENIKLLDIIEDLNCPFEKNRHGGIKLQLTNITVDLWSLENNWAFKNNLVKLNEKDKLNSIAKGCFFNYDSLVINLHNYSYNIKFYNDFKKEMRLDILLKSPIYKNLNPTTEANIIRAFYIKQMYSIDFSKELTEYIVKKITTLTFQFNNGIHKILNVKSKYPKYDLLLDDLLVKEINHLVVNRERYTNDLFLDL